MGADAETSRCPFIHFGSYVVFNFNDYRKEPLGHRCECLSLYHNATEWAAMQATLAVPRSADGRLCYDYLLGTITVPGSCPYSRFLGN